MGYNYMMVWSSKAACKHYVTWQINILLVYSDICISNRNVLFQPDMLEPRRADLITNLQLINVKHHLLCCSQ